MIPDWYKGLWLVVSLAAMTPASADYAKGIAAYQRGQPARAAMELLSSAVRGEARAQTALGLLYELGEGVPLNYSKAREWYTRAAEQDFPEAQYNLGHLYEQSLGVARDDALALKWYQAAADRDHPIAQYNLGLRYQTGEGVTRDLARAAHWYQKAAVNGEISAAVNLAYLYATGQGVPRDPVLAMAWYSAPGADKVKAARKGRELLEGVLTPAQIAEARGLAQSLPTARPAVTTSAAAAESTQ